MTGFALPPIFDYGATLLYALSGALVAARRGYDIAGVFAIALAAATGGGLIRDGFFLQRVPSLVTHWEYLAIVVAATACVWGFGTVLGGAFFEKTVAAFDSLSLGAYAAFGTDLALHANIGLAGAMLIGTINAVGGGVLRDLLLQVQPQIFTPGELIAISSAIGCGIFAFAALAFHLGDDLSAWITIAGVFGIRWLSSRYGVRTHTFKVYQGAPQDGTSLTD